MNDSNRALCKELHSLLVDARLSHSERMQRVKALNGVEKCITQALSDAFIANNWDEFELYVWAAFCHPATSITPILCQALRLKSRVVPNEDILQVLAEIKDPASLKCLREILYWRPEWDEFDQVGVKALWAIAAIKTTEARQLITEATAQGSEAVQVWARRKLNQL